MTTCSVYTPSHTRTMSPPRGLAAATAAEMVVNVAPEHWMPSLGSSTVNVFAMAANGPTLEVRAATSSEGTIDRIALCIFRTSFQTLSTALPCTVREPHLCREAKAAGVGQAAFPDAKRRILAGVSRAVPDERPVHVDVVEDRSAEDVRAAERILRLVEDDLDPLDRARDRDERKVCWTGGGGHRGDAVRDKRRPPAEPDPSVSGEFGIGRRRAAAEEEEPGRGEDVEPRRTRATMRSKYTGVRARAVLPDVVTELGERDALHVVELGARRGEIGDGRAGLHEKQTFIVLVFRIPRTAERRVASRIGIR